MVTSVPLQYGAELRTGRLQPLVAVLPAALSRYGLVWTPGDSPAAHDGRGPVADALRRRRQPDALPRGLRLTPAKQHR